MAKKEKIFADFEDPNRCSYCRDPISEADQKRGAVLHIKVAPVKALNPETGEVMGFVQPEGPANRYLHARPCAEIYANTQLVCRKCNGWNMAKQGGTLCLCVCHPPKNKKPCAFMDNDLERAGGQ